MSETMRGGVGTMGEPVLKSLDGVTSPVSYSRGPGGSIEVTMFMSQEGFELLESLAGDVGAGLEDVIGRALVLYRDARHAAGQGKAVGVTSAPETLDVQFIDL